MPHILTFHQYKVLEILSKRSLWTLKDISEILHISKSAASKCVKRLEEHGVIQKEMYEDHGQYMNISITQDGKEAIHFITTQKFV